MSRRSLRALLIVAVFAAAFSGCGRHRYAQIVGKLREHSYISDCSRYFHLKATGKDGKPLANLEIDFVSRKGTLKYVSNADGIVTIPVSEDMERENPALVVKSARHGRLTQVPSYARLLGGAARSNAEEAAQPDVALLFYDSGSFSPLSSVEVKLLRASGTAGYTADATGVVRIPRTKDLLEENPVVVVEYGGKYRWCRNTRYAGLLGPFAEDYPIAGKAEYLQWRVTDDMDRPVACPKIRILSANGTLEIAGSRDGVLAVPVSKELLRENPFYLPVVGGDMSYVRSAGFMPPKWSWYAFAPDKVAEVTPRGTEVITTEHFTIWYAPECAEEAETARRSLQLQYDAIKKATALEPVRWAVIIVPEMTPNAIYKVRQPKSATYVMCYPALDVRSGFYSGINAHEWTEMTIARRLNLYAHDRGNRFIGDGIAEYVAYLCDSRHVRDTADLVKLMEKGTRKVNLLREFRASILLVPSIRLAAFGRTFGAGYELSFAFWHEVCRAHGEDIPARFLARLQDEKRWDSRRAIGILEELTGDESLRGKLEAADVKQAVELLESIKGAKKQEAAETASAPAR